jgi:hypothetical protein
MHVYKWTGITSDSDKKLVDKEFYEKSCIPLYDEAFKSRALSRLEIEFLI